MNRKNLTSTNAITACITTIFFLFALYINPVLTPAYAESRGLGINFDFVAQGEKFIWRSIVSYNNSAIGPTTQVSYAVFHCGFSTSDKGEGIADYCGPGAPDYRGKIIEEIRTIDTSVGNTLTLTHPSVSCGTLQIDFGDPADPNGGIFGGDTYDTGVACGTATDRSNVPTAPVESQQPDSSTPTPAATRGGDGDNNSDNQTSTDIFLNLWDIFFGGDITLPDLDIDQPGNGTPTAIPTIEPGTDVNVQLTPVESDVAFSTSLVSSVRNSCLQNQAVYQQVQTQTGLPWQMVAGVHFVEGSCNPSASCFSGRRLGVVEPDMRGNCTPNSRRVAGGCVFDSLLASCIDGARHFINKIGEIPDNVQEFAAAARWYNGIGNDNCRPGRSPYTWCPAAFPGEDHTHGMTWFNGDLSCKSNSKSKFCLYKIYCTDGGMCPFGTRQERPGSVTVAKILGLDL